MAKIGLDNFLYAPLTEDNDGTATYGTAKKPGKAISCSVSMSTALVVSSSISTAGLTASALASDMRCFCPPESPTPRSPTMVS